MFSNVISEVNGDLNRFTRIKVKVEVRYVGDLQLCHAAWYADEERGGREDNPSDAGGADGSPLELAGVAPGINTILTHYQAV
jgi:hypothetical protein